jgi:quercetin dioxygenase-like cupin family protein
LEDEFMAIPHAQPGQVINVRPLGSDLASQRTTTLVKSDTLEVVRLVLPNGKEIAEHRAPGPITVQCLEGKVAFTALGNTASLEPGSLRTGTAFAFQPLGRDGAAHGR